MSVTIIAALTRDLAIGHQGDLLYHISDDLRHFRALTTGHPIIMGRKTFESFPKGALPDRRNIVVTRNRDYAAAGIETAPSLQAAIELASTTPCPGNPGIDASNIYIIGGGEIYRQALPLADRLELTVIDTERPDADTRFPHIELPVSLPMEHTDPRSGLAYTFLTIENN